MIIKVDHWTEYRYSEEVSLSLHRLRMKPRNLPYQRVLESHYEFFPQPSLIREIEDSFENHVSEVFIEQGHRSFQIKSLSRIETLPRQKPVSAFITPWEKVVGDLQKTTDLDPRHYVYPSIYAPWVHGLHEWTRKSFPEGAPILECVNDLSKRIFSEFTFDPTATIVSTPISEILQKKRGVCQDFAHLQIAALRSMGLAARYVSGYIRTDPRPGQLRLIGGDASHAWVSFYCPEDGWIDVDPTNNRLVDESYAVIGWGKDYGDVSLIRGTLTGGGSHSLYLSVDLSEG
jgi:transglutaminase-like putative cysteine protease